MKDSVNEIAEYFSKRAARYQASQETCPLARSLDLIPYVYAIEGAMRRFGRKPGELKVFDAFGGAGFLSRSFSHTEISFTIADCTSSYTVDSNKTHEWLVCPDYFRAISETRAGQYDLVFAHGGLHHVYVKAEKVVDDEQSFELQLACLRNLARLLRPGGTLVLGDIPLRAGDSFFNGSDLCSAELDTWSHLLGEERMGFLKKAFQGFAPAKSLRSICGHIQTSFREPIHDGSLQRFFNQFVALQTPLGHEARFVDFARIAGSVSADGLNNCCTFAYPGAWLFQNQQQAIWFFREMFGFGTPTLPFAIVPRDVAVKKAIGEGLGLRNTQDGVAVNWGVTYSIFVKR